MTVGNSRETDRLITVREAADILRCHPRTVRNLIARGDLEGRQLGQRMLRVYESDVRAAVKPIRPKA